MGTWTPPTFKAPDPPRPTPGPPPEPPKTLDEARAQGVAAPGLVVVAPLAPKTGPIPGKPGDFVGTVLKSFWDSPTIKSLRNAIVLAILVGGGIVASEIIKVKGNWEAMDWHVTLDAAGAAALLSLAFGYAAWLKVRDNDPVK